MAKKTIELTGKNYIERDSSWISFNKRVLYQATRKTIPLVERLKFIGICSSNLDEFIRVRFASHMGFTDYDKLRSKIIRFKRQQEEVYQDLMKEMKKSTGIQIVKYRSLSENKLSQVNRYFESFIRDIVVPMTYHTGSIFPHVKSDELYALIGMENDGVQKVSVISLKDIPRLLKVEEKSYVMIEDIIFNNLEKIYGNQKFYYKGLFKLNRSASLELGNQEGGFIVDKMKSILCERETSIPVLMDVSSTIPREMLHVLGTILNIRQEHIYITSRHVDLTYLISKPFKLNKEESLEYNPFIPKDHKAFKKSNVFNYLDDGKDLLLHHPYESFNSVIEFLNAASEDKKVKAIRQTLYRVSSTESPIVEALCKAASNGKNVTVMIEIKARFDESKNIALIDKLTNAGCQIVFGIEQIKTHAKFSLVVRETKKGLKSYAHIGTGNYNDKTAQVYTDISLFTANQKICRDLISIFNILSGSATPGSDISLIKFAPHNLRESFYEKIDQEIDNVKNDKHGYVIMKINSLSDEDMIRKIYEASEKGVKFTIICRGVCSIKAINKNIEIRSIVGRFLEHSRIFVFGNDGKEEVYISSADLLTRNLDRRVEVLVPILDKKAKDKLLKIISMMMKDTYNTFIINDKKDFKEPKNKGYNSHEEFIAYHK